MKDFIYRKALWLLYRIPRLYMTRTEYAFWLEGQRQVLQRRLNAERP